MTQKPKRTNNKKIDRASQKKSKVVMCNTHETKAMVDLAINLDKLTRHIRSEMGYSIPQEESAKILDDCRRVVALVAEFTDELADRIGYSGLAEPASVTNLIGSRNR